MMDKQKQNTKMWIQLTLLLLIVYSFTFIGCSTIPQQEVESDITPSVTQDEGIIKGTTPTTVQQESDITPSVTQDEGVIKDTTPTTVQQELDITPSPTQEEEASKVDITPTIVQKENEINLSPLSSVTYDGSPKTVTWLVNSGGSLAPGIRDEERAVYEAAVEAFNEANPNVTLELRVLGDDDTLGGGLFSSPISDVQPDIVSLSVESSIKYTDWVNLQPIVDEMAYDLGQFMPELVEHIRIDEELVGLPLMVSPSVIYYNRDLFDKAGLDYPPHKFGELYADGDPWDFDKVREIGMLLTLDENGNDATSRRSNQYEAVQWGFLHQQTDIRVIAHFWGAADVMVTDANGDIVLPDSYREGITWTYDAIWEDYFHPNLEQQQSELLFDPSYIRSGFGSGNVGMVLSSLAYLNFIYGSDFEWDVAVVPAVDGTYTSNLSTEVFRMVEYGQDDEQKQAAFSAISYLVGEASADLATVKLGMSARPDQAADIFTQWEEEYEITGFDWQLFIDSLQYNDRPTHEKYRSTFAIRYLWEDLQNYRYNLNEYLREVEKELAQSIDFLNPQQDN